MFQTAVDAEADILLVSEPFYKYGPEDRWCLSTDRLAAVAISQQSSLTRDAQSSLKW